MKPASSDLERRRPVWVALSEFFLDTEFQPGDLQRIAQVLADSGYSDEELEYIFRREVSPAVGANLLSVAGEWAGFDPEWLEARILERERGWSRWLPAYGATRLVRDDWDHVQRLLGELRR